MSLSKIQKQADQAQQRYLQLKTQLEREHPGCVVAIALDSDEYVLGEDEQEAAQKARKQYPGMNFYFFRIGEPVLHKLR